MLTVCKLLALQVLAWAARPEHGLRRAAIVRSSSLCNDVEFRNATKAAGEGVHVIISHEAFVSTLRRDNSSFACLLTLARSSMLRTRAGALTPQRTHTSQICAVSRTRGASMSAVRAQVRAPVGAALVSKHAVGIRRTAHAVRKAQLRPVHGRTESRPNALCVARDGYGTSVIARVARRDSRELQSARMINCISQRCHTMLSSLIDHDVHQLGCFIWESACAEGWHELVSVILACFVCHRLPQSALAPAAVDSFVSGRPRLQAT